MASSSSNQPGDSAGPSVPDSADKSVSQDSTAPSVPDPVKLFVEQTLRYLLDSDVQKIERMYKEEFDIITQELYKHTPWPDVTAVAPLVHNNALFCLLYEEMRFRHIFELLRPTLSQRIEAWTNYCHLFSFLMGNDLEDLQLPNQWLWDIIDGFVDQFQEFNQYRANLKNKTEDELAQLKDCEAWDMYLVFNVLHDTFVNSKIIKILGNKKSRARFTAKHGYDESGGTCSILKMIGYFSMVGLLRVHCMCGDYTTGLNYLDPMVISEEGVFTTVIGCYVNTIYHHGFANFMLKRYSDAIRGFERVLLHIIQFSQYKMPSQHEQMIQKKNDQMYALLALIVCLCPQVEVDDDTVSSELAKKYGKEISKMRSLDDEAIPLFEQLFFHASPNFISPSPPSYEESHVNCTQDAIRVQLDVFFQEVMQQQQFSKLRAYSKVHPIVPLVELASEMQVDVPTLRAILMSYKYSTIGLDSRGKMISNAEFGFRINDETIYFF